MSLPPAQSPGQSGCPRPPAVFAGLPNCAAKAWLALSNFSSRGRGAVFCAREEEEVSDFLRSAEALNSITGGKIRLKTIQFGEERLSRAAAMNLFVSAAKGEIVLAGASWRSLALPAPEPAEFTVNIQTITRGGALRRDALCGSLAQAGYERAEFVEQPGEYAVRGAVVDVYPPSLKSPARLYFSGDRVESIRLFDIETQSTSGFLDSLEIIPCKTDDGAVSLRERLAGQLELLLDKTLPADEAGQPPPDGAAAALLYPVPLAADAGNFGAARHPAFNGDMARVISEIERLGAAGMKVCVSCLNRGELERVSELFAEHRARAGAELCVSRLREGFAHPPSGFAVMTSGDIFARRYSSGSLLEKFDSSNAKRIRFKDLKPGDFVVHEHYGIAKYLGLRTISPEGASVSGDSPDAVECLLLEYKNNHRLFVPLYDFSRVRKFVGAEGKRPRLSGLSGKSWGEVKKRVKKGVEDAAKEILRIEAERAAAQSPVLAGDPHIEREFADSFPFEETPDQAKAIDVISGDLELPRPMDRVLAGDVGFGKTEVAMRAALRCALSGRQAALFAPTTVLAAQHYRTFSQRFAGFPVKLAMLCRFQTAAEQKTIVADLRAGAVDIVIGTHRLLSKDIAFKNLGLCIIDEEHRFGVHQKEKVRQIARGVHTLLLSATPIPRTLYQSMSGLREISVIETPPSGRMPIATRVSPWDDKIAAAAIREELQRGGQVYYVHNRVRTMASRLAFLQTLVPEARIRPAHGQMEGAELERAMFDFFNRSYDVLLASTIIESGLDMPEVNTLIVENAHEFGLSQLYQLRGRIGRGDKKAYCYLFYPPWLDRCKKGESPPDDADFADESVPLKRRGRPARRGAKSAQPQADRAGMTEEACQRLAALMEFSELGSGFRLAMRDLEIRGAGELLGLRQHGFINEVGLSLYCDMLSSEVSRLKGGARRQLQPASFDAPVPAFIPPDYMPDETERLNWYRRLLGADDKTADEILAKLEDVSGPAPQSVKNIAEVMKLRHLAARSGVRHLEFNNGALEIYFLREAPPPSDTGARLLAKYADRVRFLPSPLGDGARITAGGADSLDFAREIVSFLRHG